MRVPRAVGTKIACPKGGCIRIPANCIVTMEENWDGGPTGNELIACPWSRAATRKGVIPLCRFPA
ncbi:MAG: hypothetical protein Q7T81_10950 [Pseudolabrys sp.]|nr:hypothetical protein [Pseudolabrys sp.]